MLRNHWNIMGTFWMSWEYTFTFRKALPETYQHHVGSQCFLNVLRVVMMWLGCLGFLCCYWGDIGSKSIYLIGIRITWDVAKTNYDIPVVIKLIKQLSDVIEMVLVYHRLLSLVQIPSHIIIFISILTRAQARMDWILYKTEFRLGCSTLEEADYTILYNQCVLIC
jgi:hypothetical protein